MFQQRSIQNIVSANGIGVHSGKNVHMVLRPAEVNTGIIFHRVDLPKIVDLHAIVKNVGKTHMASVLQKGEVRVSTVEHLMSALSGLGIDNIHIDLNAEEVPIMDGSAAEFVYLLRKAGIVEQTSPRIFLKVLKSVEVVDSSENSEKWARLEPYNGFSVAFSIDFEHPIINASARFAEVDLSFSCDSYVNEVSRARTFGFMKDVETLRSMGLARGGNLDNVIVLDKSKILNKEGLRYDDEFVKHKILDAIGDLYLLGKPILARYTAHKSGHTLNNRLIKTLLDQKDAWVFKSYKKKVKESNGFCHGEWKMA